VNQVPVGEDDAALLVTRRRQAAPQALPAGNSGSREPAWDPPSGGCRSGAGKGSKLPPGAGLPVSRLAESGSRVMDRAGASAGTLHHCEPDQGFRGVSVSRRSRRWGGLSSGSPRGWRTPAEDGPEPAREKPRRALKGRQRREGTETGR
jgi:hypothetical protein